MANVDVSFTALPAHVRTARLIALAVARRIGVQEEILDEVRLAVGEACSRAVGVHVDRAPDEPVRMRLSDDDSRFTVEVTDVGPLEDAAEDSDFVALGAASDSGRWGDDGYDAVPAGFGLVVIGGLVDEVVVNNDATGTHVRMSWPVSRPTSD